MFAMCRDEPNDGTDTTKRFETAFLVVLDKGKPAVRRGRKAMGS
jgi:hypothetical protein